MAMTQQQRDEKRAEKAARLEEKVVRLKLPDSTKLELADLMNWAQIDEQGEALTLMIHHAHDLGRDGVVRLVVASHKNKNCENVGRINSDLPVRFSARKRTLLALADLVAWAEARDPTAAMRLLIESLHDVGPEQSLCFLRSPAREKYEIPAAFVRKLEIENSREALRNCHDE